MFMLVCTLLHLPLIESVPTRNPQELESSESDISEISAETACADVDLSMTSFDPSDEGSST